MKTENDSFIINYLCAIQCLNDLIKIYVVDIDSDGTPNATVKEIIKVWEMARDTLYNHNSIIETLKSKEIL